jgi:hypothetical protein
MKVSTLLSKSGLYRATEYTMNDYQLGYLANETFKRASRRKRPSEDATIYTDLIQHVSVMPICRYIIDTINDVVFEPGIQRTIEFANPNGTIINSEQQDWATLFQLDADLTNTNLNGVMENIGDLTGIFGHCWVFVDMPETQPGYEGSLRPYVVPISPLNVWDYEFTSVRGVQIPEYVKVLERETSESYYFKCYFLGTKSTPSYWECYEVEKGEPHESELEPESTGTFPLGMSIPGFIAYTKRDPRRLELGISDIDMAVGVQKEVFKLECEAYSSIQFARTLIRADAGVKVPAQAGSIVRATQGQVEAISVDQQDVTVIIQKQQDLLTNLQNLTGLGGLSTSSKQVQSGVAIIQERKALHRMAKAKSRLMAICEEQIWTFASRFMGVRWAGEVAYNTDYESGDTEYKLTLMERAKALAGDNPVIQGMIVKELVKLMSEPEEVKHYVDAAVVNSDPLTTVFVEENEADQIVSRDVGDQTPPDEPGEIGGDSKEDMEEHSQEGNGDITYTGQSYSTENAIAAQLGFGSVGGR